MTPSPTMKVWLPGDTAERILSVEEFENAFSIHYLHTLLFPTEAIRKEAACHCPLLLRWPWLTPEIYDWSCIPKQPDMLLEGRVSIRWIDAMIGYGVFAETEIPEGTCIGEYTGAVRRLYRSDPDHNGYCFHYPTKWWSWHYLAIDALHQGNCTRFINHSDTPNLKPICLIKERLLHLFLITTQKIKRGEQLTFTYGLESHHFTTEPVISVAQW